MGRAFEYRKARKLKRWGSMSKTFTKIGREIAKAVKESGPHLESNSKLRAIIQNAREANMPKENVERAIKKASEKSTESWEERVYEGYGKYGIAILVETLTNNPTRTVANIRALFNKYEATLGTTGSLDFLFDRKCVFKIGAGDINQEEFEFEIIDYGGEEIDRDDEENALIIYGRFEDFGKIQGFIEEKKYELKSAAFERIPTDTKALTSSQEEEINRLIEKLEEDDDVQMVFTTMG